MPNPARRNVQATTESSFWRQRWESIEPAACALIEDCMLCLIFLAALTIVFLGLSGLALLGYDPQRIDMFETIHYYAYLGVFSLFVVDLAIRVLLHTFKRK